MIKDPKLSEDAARYAGLIHPGADLLAEAKECKKKPRRFNRLLVEALYPGMVRERWTGAGPELIIAYRGHAGRPSAKWACSARPRTRKLHRLRP